MKELREIVTPFLLALKNSCCQSAVNFELDGGSGTSGKSAPSIVKFPVQPAKRNFRSEFQQIEGRFAG